MLPDFNRLRIFYHIYKQESSTAAANVLHITQSGVSQHLKKLEDELQTSLFTRVNRRLVPTAAGYNLYTIVQKFMIQLEQGVQNINATLESPSGLLRIGGPSEFGRTYIPQIFASFRCTYPEVSLQLELGDPKVLFSKVATGDLDFAYIDILPIYFETPGGLSVYDIEPILTEELVLACSKKYYDDRIFEESYEELITLDYISYKTDISLFHGWFLSEFGKEISSLELAMIVDSPGAIISGMENDMGVGIITSHLITKQVTEGSLVIIKGASEQMKNTISCVCFKDKKQTITESCFQQYFARELKVILPS